MRRLARRLFTLCSAVSLVLCVAVCVLWVRSYSVAHSVDWSAEKRVGTAGVSLGIAYVYDDRIISPTASYSETEDEPYGVRHHATKDPIGWPTVSRSDGQNVDGGFGNLRFAYHDGTGTAWESITWCVTAPCWLVTVALGVLPMWWAARRWTRWRQFRAGSCLNCGYDLRATPDRCPECGTASAPPADSPG